MKLTPQELKFLLDDLYTADPSLREREKELTQLIQKLTEAKPDAKISAEFLKTLRNELIDKAKAMSTSMKSPQQVGMPKKASSKFWPAIGFTTVGIAVAVMAMFFVMEDSLVFKSPVSSIVSVKGVGQQIAYAPIVIDHVAKAAFGDLSLNSVGAAKTMNASGAPSALGMGGGGGMMATRSANNASSYGTAETAAAPVPPTVQANDATVTSGVATAPNMKIMPPYQQEVVEYVYKGDAIDLKDTSLDVLKRSNGIFPTGNLAAAIQGMNIGIADLSSFQNTSVSDISLYQDTQHGYQMYISPRNGTMSIDQNWEKWQDANPNCQDDACWKASQLKESDVPSSDELVKLADAFLDTHHIDRSTYGPGEVDMTWKQQYAVPMMAGADGNSEEVTQVYVPDTMQVTYPLLVNGQTVYQNGGAKMGITVGVNIRVKQVVNVYNLQSLKFDASSYDAITDSNAILDEAKKGGMASPIRYMMPNDLQGAKKVQAELGTPVRGLVQIYQYKDNQSLELYVPALIFPVTKKADSAQWTPNFVIVPIVKGVEQDVPQIMPYAVPAGAMMKGGTVSGSAGEGSSASSPVGSEVIVPPAPPVPAPVKK